MNSPPLKSIHALEEEYSYWLGIVTSQYYSEYIFLVEAKHC